MKEFNIDFEYAINNDIISIADVLENIEKKRTNFRTAWRLNQALW